MDLEIVSFLWLLRTRASSLNMSPIDFRGEPWVALQSKQDRYG